MPRKIKTKIDDFVSMLDGKKEVKIEEVSKKLKVDADTIEEWAKILEDKGILDIEYSPFGPGKIRKVKVIGNTGEV